MKLKAVLLALFVAGFSTSFALAGNGPGKGDGKGKAAATGSKAAAKPKPKGPAKKVKVCHRRADGTYGLLQVGAKAAKAHRKHGDVLPSADGACPAATTPAPGDDEAGETTGTTTDAPATTAPTTTG
jgi:hypothetical protein